MFGASADASDAYGRPARPGLAPSFSSLRNPGLAPGFPFAGKDIFKEDEQPSLLHNPLGERR
jgi:hypothetical protein